VSRFFGFFFAVDSLNLQGFFSLPMPLPQGIDPSWLAGIGQQAARLRFLYFSLLFAKLLEGGLIMKRALLVLALAVAGVRAFPQDRIAVFPFEDLNNIFTGNDAVMFYSQFSNEFANRVSGRFAVVPRQEIERLINTEARFQISRFSAMDKTAEMRRVLNGTLILSGIIGRVGNRINISVSLYTFPELRQLPGGADMRVARKQELFDRIPELARDMQSKMAANSAVIAEALNKPAEKPAEKTVEEEPVFLKTGVAFEGYALSARNRQNVITGLKNTAKTWKLNLDVDEGLNPAAGYAFTFETGICNFLHLFAEGFPGMGQAVDYENVIPFRRGFVDQFYVLLNGFLFQVYRVKVKTVCVLRGRAALAVN